MTPPRGIRLPGWPPAPISPPAPAAVAPKEEPPPLVLEQEAVRRVQVLVLVGDEYLRFCYANPKRHIAMIVYDKKHPARYTCTVVG